MPPSLEWPSSSEGDGSDPQSQRHLWLECNNSEPVSSSENIPGVLREIFNQHRQQKQMNVLMEKTCCVLVIPRPSRCQLGEYFRHFCHLRVPCFPQFCHPCVPTLLRMKLKVLPHLMSGWHDVIPDSSLHVTMPGVMVSLKLAGHHWEYWRQWLYGGSVNKSTHVSQSVNKIKRLIHVWRSVMISYLELDDVTWVTCDVVTDVVWH